VVKVRNGTPPFTWIADGRPVSIATRERQVQIVPLGPGFMDLSVVDANGLSQNARVELR
jgi:penicillin-binding protein 1C